MTLQLKFRYVNANVEHDELDSLVGFRQVEETDEPFLKKVFCELRTEDIAAWEGIDGHQKDFLLGMQFDSQKQHYARAFPHADHQIITWKDEPIGQLLTHESESEKWCVDITILSDFRNRGIGSHVLAKLVEESNRDGMTFCLDVAKTNPAVALYERFGLRIKTDLGSHWRMKSKPD